MFPWIRSLTAVAAVAYLGLIATSCSEAPQPTAAPVGVEEVDAAAEAAAAARVKEATESPVENMSAETQARIDAYTADAVASMKRSADFLAAQKNLSFQTDVAYDVIQPNGQMLEFGGTRDVLMRRPDRLRIESVDRDGGVKQLFFDGTSLLVDMPNEDVYTRVEKPGTLYAAMDYLVEELGAPAPLEDFISENFAADADEEIVSGFYVQHVMLDAGTCEHLAFRTKTVDFQLWVREGEEPVPCRVVITYKNAPGHPQFVADFHDWNFAPEVDDDLFTFTPPESAEQIQAQAVIRELRDDREGK